MKNTNHSDVIDTGFFFDDIIGNGGRKDSRRNICNFSLSSKIDYSDYEGYVK